MTAPRYDRGPWPRWIFAWVGACAGFVVGVGYGLWVFR